MSTSEIKIELFRQIDQLDETSLKKIYSYLVRNFKTKTTDFWDDLTDEQKADINAGLSDLKKGKKKNFHDVIDSL
jgi:hypothetical protein